MAKLKSVWVITDDTSGIVELVSGAKSFGDEVTLVCANDKSAAVGADTVYFLGDLSADSFINYVPAITSLVTAARPELVLTGTTKNGRLIAGTIAAAVGTTVLTDISELTLGDDGLTGKRMVYGGKAIKEESVANATVVACLGGGVFAASDLSPSQNIVELQPSCAVKFIEKRPKEGKTVNLAAAKRIVCAGRGIGSQENLELLRQLGKLIGAELGCTRPIAEEEKWLPKESYIGVSGVMLKPDLYLGAGVSGQIQHTVGINRSGVIFAINKDANAPIFSQCDYGIVGDVKDIIPALIDKLGGK